MDDSHYSYKGSCRCGAVSLVYRCTREPGEQAARACQCEFCAPRAAIYLSDPASLLEVTVRDRRWLYAHRFGTATADFMHCARCNTLAYVQSEIDGKLYALVSAEILDGFEGPGCVETVSYDGESLEQRLQRRAQRWIPELSIREDHAG